jgi:hypothetical protein
MLTFDQIRQKYPSAQSLSDGEIVDKLAQLTGAPYEQVASRFGWTADTPRGVLGAANDYAIEAANSAAGLVGSIGNMVSPGNRVSQFIDENIIERGPAMQSIPAQIAKRRLGASLATDDIGTQASGVWDYVTENPGLAAAQAAGSFAPLGLGIKGVQGAASALGAGATAASRAGLGAGAVLSGAASGGDAGGSAYELVMTTPWETLSQHPQAQELLAQGADENAVREELATRAARVASVVPAAIGAVAGATGAEKALTSGVRGLAGVGKTILKEFAGEALEEGSTAYSGQRAAQEYNPDINPMDGVAGSALLGGVLGAGVAAPIGLARMQREPKPTVDDGQFDITQRDAGPLPQLGYNPLAGTPIVFPDGTVALNGEQELQARYGPGMATPSGAATTATAAEAPVAPKPTLVQSWEKELIDLGLPAGSVQGKRGESIYGAVTALREAELGPELDDAVFTALRSGASAPGVTKAIEAFAEAKQSGLTPADLEQAVQAVAAREFSTAARLVKKAIIEGEVARRSQANGQNVVAAPDAAAAAPAAPGAQAVQSPAAPDASAAQAVESPAPGAVVSTPAAVGVTDAPAVTQPISTTAPTNLMERRAPADDELAWVDRDELENRAEIEALTGNTGASTAALQDISGRRAEGDFDTDAFLGSLVRARFQKSATANRDAEITLAYLRAMRDAPKGSKVAIQEGIGKQYGISAQMVRKLGNTTELVNAGKELGYTDAEVRRILDIRDNTKAAPKEATDEVDEESTDSGAQLTGAMRDAGVDTADGETLGFGYDDARFWAAPETTAEAKAEAVNSMLQQQDSLRALLVEYAESGQDTAVEAVQKQLDKLNTQLEKALDAYQKYLGGDKKVAPEVPKVDLGEATVAAKKRLKEAKGDVTKLSDEDLPLIRNEFARLKNADGVAKAEAELAKRGITMEAAPVVETPPATAKATKAKKAKSAGAVDGQALWDQMTAADPGLKSYEELDALQRGALDDIVEKFGPKVTVKQSVALATMLLDARKPADAQFGKSDAPANPYTAKELLTELKQFMRMGSLNGRVTVVDDVGDLTDLRDLATGITNGSAFGWARNGNVVLVANRIEKGTGRAKFMHEVGTHLGLENLLSPAQYDRLTQKIVDWAKADDGSVENRLATRAAARVQNAKTKPEDRRAELLAYFVEESVLAGIDPTATQELRGPLRQWFDALIKAFKAALVRLGAKPDSLVAKDIVDLAYGAAKLELESEAVQDDRGPQFGVNAPTESVIQQNIARLPRQTQAPVRNSLKSIQSWVSKGLDRVVFTADLIGRAEKAGVSAARKFADLVARRATDARKMEREVEKIADMFADIPSEQRDAVNQFLFNTTRSGRWPYDQGNFKATAEDKSRFDEFHPAAQRFIRAVFKHGTNVLAKKKQTVLDYTASEYDALIKAAQDAGDTQAVGKLKRDKAADLRKYDSLFAVRQGMPYAPIKRMGDFVVIAKSTEYVDAELAGDKVRLAKLEASDDHYRVTFKDTLFAANQLADQYRAAGFTSVGASARLKAREQFFQGSDAMTAVMKLQSLAKQKGNSKLQAMVADIVLQTLADNSARKSEMRRRNVAGEVDMLQSFAVQGKADAQFMASVKYNQPTQDAMQEMFRQASTARDRNRANEVVDELNDRYQSSLQFEPQPWLNKLNRLTSIYFLATSPAYYLQNLMQPWMMSLPAMAGQHDYTKAAAMLATTYGELKDVMKSAKLFEQGFDFTKVPADVRDAIQELANRGRIDIGLDTELGEFQVGEAGKVSKLWNKIDKGMRLLVQKGEAINRLTTAMTAYRLAKGSGASEAGAIDYAERILSETHGDYGPFNAPKYFNTSLGKVALQFRKFQLIQLSFYAKLFRDAFTNPKERKAAIKTLTYALGHTGLLAGAVGMPGYAAIAWVLGQVAGDDDEPYDLTYEIRKMIGDEDIANVVLRGAPVMAGMDISGKVGAGTMLSVMPFSNADLTSPQGRAEALGTLLGGAAFGVANRLTDGVGLMLAGDWYRGLEYALPKGLGDAMKAARIADEGMTRRNGDVILPASEVSAVESIIQGIGFLPADQSVVYERRSRSYEMDNRMQDRSKSIKQDYVKAMRDRDTEAMTAARAEWAELQAARRRNGYKVQPMSELLKAPQAQAKRERDTLGGVQYNRNTEGFARQNAGI